MNFKLINFLFDFVNSFRSLKVTRLKYNKSEATKKNLSILGNGPSLQDYLNASFIDGSDNELMCVNNFCESEWFLKVMPKHYVFADPAYWKSSPNSPYYSELVKICELISRVDWHMNIYLPSSVLDSNFVKKLTINKYISIIPYNSRAMIGKYHYYSSIILKNNLLMPQPANVLVACIYLGLNLGFQEIKLFGVDHSWFLNMYIGNDNIPRFLPSHFVRNVESLQSNLIGTPIYKDVDETLPFTMAELFNGYKNLFESYEILAQYAKYLEVSIKNHTQKSMIDSFERSINSN